MKWKLRKYCLWHVPYFSILKSRRRLLHTLLQYLTQKLKTVSVCKAVNRDNKLMRSYASHLSLIHFQLDHHAGNDPAKPLIDAICWQRFWILWVVSWIILRSEYGTPHNLYRYCRYHCTMWLNSLVVSCRMNMKCLSTIFCELSSLFFERVTQTIYKKDFSSNVWSYGFSLYGFDSIFPQYELFQQKLFKKHFCTRFCSSLSSFVLHSIFQKCFRIFILVAITGNCFSALNSKTNLWEPRWNTFQEASEVSQFQMLHWVKTSQILIFTS